MMMNRQDYVELHSLERDIIYSACGDCYKEGLDCLRYYDKCRKEDWGIKK